MKKTIWTRSYWSSLLERVLATLLQIVIGFLTAFVANGSTFNGWDWKNTLTAIVVGTVLSLLKGILANLATKDGPSLLHTEQVKPELPAPADS